MSRHDNSNDQPRNGSIGRRDMLRVGGLTIASAAVISACGEHERGEVGRVGAVPTTVKLPEAVVTNVALLRTASSFEHSMINVYSQVVGNSDLLDPKYGAMAARFIADHTSHAEMFEELTTAAGGTPWTCGNPKFDDVVINPVITRITEGAEATAAALAIEPSDDPRRDIINFVHGLETLAGATYQSLVGLFSDPALRASGMIAGAAAGRRAAVLALNINPDRPGGLVNFGDVLNAEPSTPTTVEATTTTAQNVGNQAQGVGPSDVAPTPTQQTEIPTVTAIPSQFGLLGAIQLVVGRGDENGTRMKLNLETPSLNSFVFEYMAPSC